MLVALVIRGGEELFKYGQTYHPWNQVQLLYEWHEVQRFLGRIRDAQSDEQICAEGYVTIRDRGNTMFMRYELSFLAYHEN
jgi:hypothetical protein